MTRETIQENEIITDKSQLLEYFYTGIKPKSEFKIGVEFEKLGINPIDYKAVPYSSKNGIQEFLKAFKKRENWDSIYEGDYLLGLTDNYDFISLEPGSQLEISYAPRKSIHEIAEQVNYYNSLTSDLAEEFGIYWLGYGIQPVSTYSNIELIPKKRYSMMTDYLPQKGDKSLVMMRETAGIQVSIDYDSDTNAVRKLRTLLKVSPIVTAIFSNSPIRGNTDTGYKSYRASSWLKTDDDRCGLISKKIFDRSSDFSFEDYVDVLLDIPMIFIQKDNKCISMKGMSFRNYLKYGYKGYYATIDDWLLHMNLFFPDIRLNSYLEIRNCDCQRAELIPAVPALWKGIAYNNDALSAVHELLEDFSWEQLREMREKVPKYGLETTINNIKILGLAKEIVYIADRGLKSQPVLNSDFKDETIYLEKVKELLSDGKTPADLILDHWYNSWNKDISKLAEYTRLV